MKLKCVENNFTDLLDPAFTVGRVYEMRDDGCIKGDDDYNWKLNDNYCYSLQPDMAKFEIVTEHGNNQRDEQPTANLEEAGIQFCDKPMTPRGTRDALQAETLRSIQEQCSKANLSISIDPAGFNIFDCDTDMQTMVHSVIDVVEILESKFKFKNDMEKYQWM